MTSTYNIEKTINLIQDYINAGGEALQIRDGVLGLGDILLYDLSGKLKAFVIKEIALNEWCSAHKIRGYNKIPGKYKAMISANVQ